MKFTITYLDGFDSKNTRRTYVLTDDTPFFRKLRDEIIYFSRCADVKDVKINGIPFKKFLPARYMNPTHRLKYLQGVFKKTLKAKDGKF